MGEFCANLKAGISGEVAFPPGRTDGEELGDVYFFPVVLFCFVFLFFSFFVNPEPRTDPGKLVLPLFNYLNGSNGGIALSTTAAHFVSSQFSFFLPLPSTPFYSLRVGG